VATDQSDVKTTEETEGERFDPRKHMGSIRTRQGQQKYLAVKWRVAWLRQDFPDCQIESELMQGGVTEGFAIFRCRISLPTGAVAVDYGSETREDFPDYLEKASTKAIGRACAILGYGTDAAPDLDDEEPMDGLPAAKHERQDRRTRRNEEQDEGGQPQPPPDPNRPITSQQTTALDRMATNGFAVLEHIQKEYNKQTVASLTIAEAAATIRAGNMRRT